MCSPYRVASNSERAFRGTRGASYHELRKRGTKVVPGIMNRRYGSPSCAGRSASKTRVDALVSRASSCSKEMKAWMAGTGPAKTEAANSPSECQTSDSQNYCVEALDGGDM